MGRRSHRWAQIAQPRTTTVATKVTTPIISMLMIAPPFATPDSFSHPRAGIRSANVDLLRRSGHDAHAAIRFAAGVRPR
jgi:hypothetical protein